MVVLTIRLDVKKGQQAAIERNFRDRFLPAVSKRPGFIDAHMAKSLDEPSQMLILLFFASEQQRLDWVASPEHDPAWNTIASLCDDFTPVPHEVLASAS